MPRHTHAAFVSYSSAYRDWVETLHANLEAILERHGERRPVFFDRLDIAAGRSWVTQLAAGLDRNTMQLATSSGVPRRPSG